MKLDFLTCAIEIVSFVRGKPRRETLDELEAHV